MESPELIRRSNPNFRRRNSIATSVVVPAKLILPSKPHHASSFPTTAAAAAASSATTSSSSSTSQSFPAVDFELISFKPFSYTSLKDLLPSSVSAVQSPTVSAPGGDISIRNRLVKQAAWAYLRPMSTSPRSSGSHFVHRFWDRVSGDLLKSPVVSFFRFVSRTLTRAFDRLIRIIRYGAPDNRKL